MKFSGYIKYLIGNQRDSNVEDYNTDDQEYENNQDRYKIKYCVRQPYQIKLF